MHLSTRVQRCSLRHWSGSDRPSKSLGSCELYMCCSCGYVSLNLGPWQTSSAEATELQPLGNHSLLIFALHKPLLFLPPLHSLTVSPCGNPITEYTLFFSYTIFRLLHLGLTQLNNTTISPDDVATAEGLFGHLGEVTTSCLPRTRLLALVSKHRSVIGLTHSSILNVMDACWLLT